MFRAVTSEGSRHTSANRAYSTRPGRGSCRLSFLALISIGLVSVQSRKRAAYPAADVIGVENTRATSLSWPQDVRDGFNAELRQLLGKRAVPLTVESQVAMARVRGLSVPAATLE
jgi:hypothetical protein